MKKNAVEIGFLLDKPLDYYLDLIKEHKCEYLCKNQMIDIYYSKEDNFDGLTENEIKNKCVRFRNGLRERENKYHGGFQNLKLYNNMDNADYDDELLCNMIKDGFKLKFIMHKTDIHYYHEIIKGDIQFQEIDGFGLMLFYYNPDYFNDKEEIQRKKLIDDLNQFGFSFNYDDLGLDRLRTLYHGEKKYSYNQNR